MLTIYNCHTHIFTNHYVPDKFLPWGLTRFLTKQKVSHKLGCILNKLNPWSDQDIFDRYAVFMNIGNKERQSEIFDLLTMFYPSNSRFIVLTVDFEFMDAGAVNKDFIAQLDELAAMKADDRYSDRLYPFICADPRRDGIADLVKKYIEEHGYAGIKIYPPLGYYPFDERLDPIYAYAQKNSIPIISHCSTGGIKYRGDVIEIYDEHPKTHVKFENKDDVLLSFAHPDNYRYLFDKFPDLKLSLGHFGGTDEIENYLRTPWKKDSVKSWFSAIIDLVKEGRSVYTDTAYALYDPALLPVLKVMLEDPLIRPKILYGTDFYMVEIDRSERAYGLALRAAIGEDNFKQIAQTNPERFLNVVK